jgi:hypothetical protein
MVVLAFVIGPGFSLAISARPKSGLQPLRDAFPPARDTRTAARNRFLRQDLKLS